MPARPVGTDDLPEPLPPVLLLVGDEDLLVDRAIGAITAAAVRADADTVVTERTGGEIEGSELHELLGPSLFGDSRLLIVRAAQDVRVAGAAVLTPYVQQAAEGTIVVLQHAGGAKGKALLETARKAKALEIGCAKLTRADDRADFVRHEIRRAGGRIGGEALSVLMDAVGSDLRELAGVAGQLVSDAGGGEVGLDLVRRFHKGKAEVSGFAVSDLAVVGRSGPALEALRHALAIGVPYVVIADALADGVRSVARVWSAGRGSEYDLAKRLGMPPWKVKRARSQGRDWSETGLRQALGVVATLNADVKGQAVDPAYALEHAVRRIGAARADR
ncbi:DNA polymerase III subunit delta [Jatrophihabitans endophyticus]|uniref:DNA polymerase III subunit delta n=1 Tax=Jatrophihabitans endophyticus TaxID=1206085 RepID=UPI000933B19B|nr:DNA polymerase III subunit delta [Jatrophihabitans endophyticus]